MKNFIKQNWFKIIIAVAVLIVAVSVGYYFAIYIPARQQEQKSDVDLQAKCATQAQKTFDDFASTMTSNSAGGDFGEQNHYNQKLDKCFVLISYISTTGLVNGGDIANHEALFDAYENTELAGSTYLNSAGKLYPCDIGDKMVSCDDYTNFVNQKMETN